MNYSNRRKQDEQGEKFVAQLLDTYFYPEFAENIERVTDKELQIRGIDTIATINGINYKIDEKAALHWSGLRTFAQEITSLDIYGREYNSWLLTSQSDYFLYVWIDKYSEISENKETKTRDNSNTVWNDNQDKQIDATVALVSKRALYNWLHSKGIYASTLLEKSKEVREAYNLMGKNWKSCCFDRLNGIKIAMDYQQEHSFLLLVPRDTLLEISTFQKHIVK